MEISRLDAGRERLDVGPVDAPALLRAIVAARGWSERVLVSGDPVALRTDPRRLERVLANLVTNAVEHGDGEIRATVAAAGPLVVFEVSDQGAGIPAEHLPRLFERFHKVDPARSGPGSGLGLAIAREHAALLGGVLSVRSESGTGTRFRLELPGGAE
ncbi:hypothetical protein GCM10027614_17000 [Micromonospora vulcania]